MPITEEEEDEWLQAIEEEDDDDALSLLETWKLPQTNGCFQAPSGHRLHIRAVLPPAGRSITAVLLYCHGLNSHVNGRSWAAGYYPRVASEGFALFAVDIMGHGYSEGVRGLVEDWDDVFDDLECFLEALMGVADPQPSAAEFDAGISAKVLAQVRRLPIFAIGTSMGGMIGMYMGLRLQNNENLRTKFKGVVMGCPALGVDLPPKAIQFLLRNLVVPLFKTSEMPAAVSSSSKAKPSWSFDLGVPSQKTIVEMEIRDCASRFPGKGLGWRKGMLWGTAGAFSSLYSHIEDDMQEVEYPFLVLHDLEDKVCFVSGSHRLMELSPSDDKTFEAVDAGGLHCLPMVIQDAYVSRMASWIRQHL